MKQAILDKILAANPCHGDEALQRWAKYWPEDVTPLWLLSIENRGDETIRPQDRVWVATILLPEKLLAAARTRAVVRLCHATATVLEKARPREAADLRSLKPDTDESDMLALLRAIARGMTVTTPGVVLVSTAEVALKMPAGKGLTMLSKQNEDEARAQIEDLKIALAG